MSKRQRTENEEELLQETQTLFMRQHLEPRLDHLPSELLVKIGECLCTSRVSDPFENQQLHYRPLIPLMLTNRWICSVIRPVYLHGVYHTISLNLRRPKPWIRFYENPHLATYTVCLRVESQQKPELKKLYFQVGSQRERLYSERQRILEESQAKKREESEDKIILREEVVKCLKLFTNVQSLILHLDCDKFPHLSRAMIAFMGRSLVRVEISLESFKPDDVPFLLDALPNTVETLKWEDKCTRETDETIYKEDGPLMRTLREMEDLKDISVKFYHLPSNTFPLNNSSWPKSPNFDLSGSENQPPAQQATEDANHHHHHQQFHASLALHHHIFQDIPPDLIDPLEDTFLHPDLEGIDDDLVDVEFVPHGENNLHPSLALLFDAQNDTVSALWHLDFPVTCTIPLSKFGGVSVPGSHADRNMRLIGQLLILCIFFHTVYGFPNKISKRLEAFVTRASDDDVQPIWVHFKDKPSVTEPPHIDEKTISRRELHGEPRWSFEDLPINVEYKEQVRSTVEEYGGHLRTISDFHNAVSASANRGAISALADLPFVTSLDIVERLSSDRKVGPDDKPSRKRADYGKSLNEWNTTSATVLTDLGLDGSGVRVLVIDSGFYLAHECFNNISVHNEYDFIHNDTRVGNKPGYTPGKMRGPAPAAEYLLAKTEKVGSDFPLEEDWFSAAVVWGELRGADIFSISIGYYSFYNWTQFDGQTARTTQAINRAVQKGVVVVMAVGNRGADGISPPSDAALTIGVGAVDATGTVASFSSIGPTADGRIKPDVSAVGVDVYSASTSTPTSYVMEDGTSVSAPYVAGVAACLKQYHPEWTNIQIREALMRSASSASSPDVRIGWGAINVQKALNYTPSASFCPNNCSGHGNCTSKGACQCETGFYDFDCSVATVQCADYCDTKGGYCTENSFVCQCKPSYSGVDCSIYGGDRFYIWQTLVSLALFVIIITAILIFTRNATLEGNKKYVRFAVYLVIAISIPLLDIGISEGLLHSAYVFTLELVWDVMDFVWKIYTAIILFRGWVPKYLNWSISVVGSLIHIVLTLPYSFYVYNSTASSGPGVVANLVKTAGLLLNDYVLLPISLYFIIRRIQGAFETADLQLTPIDGKRPESANSNAFHLTEEERAQPEEIRRDKVTDGETKVWYATHIVILLFIVFRLCEAGMSLKTTYYNQPYSTALLVAMIPMIGIFVTEKNIHYSRSFPHFYYYLFLIGAYVYVPVEVIAQLYVQAGGSAGLGFALQVGQSILMFFVTFFMKNAAKSMSYKYKYFHFVFRFQFFEEFLAFLLFLRKEVTGLLFWLSIIFQGLWTIYRNSGMLGKTIAWAWNNFKVKVGMATQTSVFGIDPEEGDKLTESVVLAQQYIVADIVAVIAIPAQFYTLYTIDSDYSRRLGINHAANVWQTYFVIGTVKAFSHVVVYALLRWRLQSYEYHRQLLRYSEDEDKERVKWTPLPSFSQMFLRQLYFYSLFFTVISFVSTRDAFSAASALFSTQG